MEVKMIFEARNLPLGSQTIQMMGIDRLSNTRDTITQNPWLIVIVL